MPKIIQLSPHVANLIAAGEVVERPASVMKELLENAVDAGASKITVEIKDGGMTFLRVTDDGCGMQPEDVATAFLRHATSKLRKAEDLAAIGTMGFRGEALAAIASVSRVDLMTKTAGALSGTSVHLEGGNITEKSEVGCPEGTTIIIRDLFFNTPARMKFMKSDTVEGGRVTSAVQMQALAHPEVGYTYVRDGKQILSTPGDGSLEAAVYCVYGRECAHMVKVESRWDDYSLTGYVSKPSASRPSRNLQTFFVNDRPIKSRLLIAALEEAYRNQLMVGKFPACVLHLKVPANAVDVNVHPAKTEVKFLSEKSVFDCVHYGVLAALNKQVDRPQIQFRQQHGQQQAAPAVVPGYQAPGPAAAPGNPVSKSAAHTAAKPESFFRTMNTEEYKTFSKAMENPPQPQKEAAAAALHAVERQQSELLRENVATPAFSQPREAAAQEQEPVVSASEAVPAAPAEEIPVPQIPPLPEEVPEPQPAVEQETIPMPEAAPWRMVGELYRTYIIVEQGDNAFLIDKHAAHERILFDKLKANQEAISSQMLLSPIPVRLSAEAAAELLNNKAMLSELGFEIDEFGDNTVLLRQIPMDLSPEGAAEAVDSLAADLLSGRHVHKDTVRDNLLHTVACKAAIKAGWVNDDQELLAIVKQVMERDDLKYCPHGRPICVSLSKRQLEHQFKRS